MLYFTLSFKRKNKWSKIQIDQDVKVQHIIFFTSCFQLFKQSYARLAFLALMKSL